jgi:hypothetical protein
MLSSQRLLPALATSHYDRFEQPAGLTAAHAFSHHRLVPVFDSALHFQAPGIASSPASESFFMCHEDVIHVCAGRLYQSYYFDSSYF